ncbi:MAG: hypothetical protein CR986_09800 [Ignavibacteriae bacterium]|nr:MAG: hypothetical protein CR986_09800 [Ignavibacteriota bacterium]
MLFIKKLYLELLKKLSPQIVLTLSFVFVILLGSVLLMQPFSLNGTELSFGNSLFTSTSATCVTGLAVVDTGTHFSLIGKIIILLLIQIGGLGVMSISVLLLLFIRGKFGIGSREIIQETLTYFETNNVKDLFKSVFIFTITIEAIGAVLLIIRFLFDMPFEEAVFSGIFHSVSAFCNAGFSLFPDSLVRYQSDFYVNFVIAMLIIIGGIGFIVMYDLKDVAKRKKTFSRLTLHSKIVLRISGLLIIVGAIFIFIFEYHVSMNNMDLKTKLLMSFFQSITTRTAGFNTLDIHSISMPTLFFITVLMYIGASPASTGGGIKTTTIAVLYAYIKTRIKNTKNVNINFSTLPSKLISKAIVINVFAIIIVVASAFILTIVELEHIPFSVNGDKFLEIFFEVVSALGTVGLSTGITSYISIFGKFILILLMICGRVGPLTIAMAIGAKEKIDIKYAEDNLLIG